MPVDSRLTTQRLGVQAWLARSKAEAATCTSGALSRVPANQKAHIACECWLGMGNKLLAWAAGVLSGMGIKPEASTVKCWAV